MKHTSENYDNLLNSIIKQFLDTYKISITGEPEIISHTLFNQNHYETGFRLVHSITLYEVTFYFRFYNIGREKRIEFQTVNNHKYFNIEVDFTELLIEMEKYWTHEINNDSKYGAKGTSKFLK
ncbi:MAG: hypothetical protein H8E71_08320 [Candidatus Marinimicrobia bacterium]|nr:hypothetical protein [Candidatus Neomarinimicrobiota bacterium]